MKLKELRDLMHPIDWHDVWIYEDHLTCSATPVSELTAKQLNSKVLQIIPATSLQYQPMLRVLIQTEKD